VFYEVVVVRLTISSDKLMIAVCLVNDQVEREIEQKLSLPLSV
jgi:hypothetical protein